MKIVNTNLYEVSNDEFLRCDAKFYNFFSNFSWNIFNYKGDLISLKDILIEDKTIFELEDDEEYFGIPTGCFLQ